MPKPNECWLTKKGRRRSNKKDNNAASNATPSSGDPSLDSESQANENLPPPPKRGRGLPSLQKQEPAVKITAEDTSSDGSVQPGAGQVDQTVAMHNGDGQHDIKVEEPDSDEAENRPVATARRQSMAQNTANLPLYSLSGNGRPDLRRLKLEVKTEARSREPSMDPVADVFGAGGAPMKLDGKVKGHSMTANERRELENASPVIYAFPQCHSNGDKSRRVGSNKRVLDLALDSEREGGDENDTTTDFTIESVITIDGYSALVDWDGYKYPTWVRRSTLTRGPSLSIYNRRMRILAPIIENFMQNETLDSIRKNYPNMSIMQTIDYGQYVKHPGILYLCGLGKRERQVNDFRDEFYGRPDDSAPLVLFVDFTDFEKSSIPIFEYLLYSRQTKAAKAIDDDLVVAKDACCQCTDRCPITKACCSMKSSTKVSYGKMGVLFNANKEKTFRKNDTSDFEKTPDEVDVYECGDRCKCDPARCMQRGVQMGSTIPLVVFMHHEKMWTLRTGEDIPIGKFICSYTGIIMTAAEAAKSRDTMYQMNLKVKTSTGEKLLVVDAKNAGSEARYIAHSCDPNVFAYRVHMGIAGRPKRNIGIFAHRDIEAGEELTIDYHIGVNDPTQFHKISKFICKCGAANCREKAFQALNKKRSIKIEID